MKVQPDPADLEDPEYQAHRLARTIYPMLKKEILSSLGNRYLEEEEINELTAYWVASIISHYPNPELDLLSDEKKYENLVKLNDGWERGIREYSRMAGESLTDIIDVHINSKGIVKMLDIGAGSLQFHKEIRERYQSRVELYAIGIKRPDPIEGVNFKLALAEVLPQEWGNRFDLVTCFESVMYFYDRLRSFKEALRVIGPGGTLFYGEGGVKDAVHNDIFRGLLDIDHDWAYTTPGENPERFYGAMGKILSRTYPAWKFVNDCIQAGNFEVEGKEFKIEEREAKAWCHHMLKVQNITK